MPVFRSAGGATVITGRGGVHPGVVDASAGSTAAGSIGTSTLSGNGSTIAATSASTVTGAYTIDNPWFTGSGNTAYSIASGSLPPGFSLNSSTGAVTGAPTISGWNESATYNFTVRGTSVDSLHTVDRAYSIAVSVPYLYRQIITKGYVLGGYQSSNPYRNVTSIANATDTLTSHGDQIREATSYHDGACGRNIAYAFCTANTWPGTTTETAPYNMRTETGSSYTAGMNTTTARNDLAATWDEHRNAFLHGGNSSQTEKFSFTTETSSNIPAVGLDGTVPEQGGTAKIVDETRALLFDNDEAQRFTFSSEAYTSVSVPAGLPTGQQKGLSTKLGKGYSGNEGNYQAGFNLRVWSFSSETFSTVAKPWTDSGEENYATGQQWGYMLGMYNGTQNTTCGKFIYATNSGYVIPGLNADAGGTIPGRSSGCGAWRD